MSHLTLIKRRIFPTSLVLLLLAITHVEAAEYLGRIGSNPFCSDCTANPYAPINNPFNPKSPKNPFGRYGNPYSPYSANNPFATDTPKVYGSAPGYDDQDPDE